MLRRCPCMRNSTATTFCRRAPCLILRWRQQLVWHVLSAKDPCAEGPQWHGTERSPRTVTGKISLYFNQKCLRLPSLSTVRVVHRQSLECDSSWSDLAEGRDDIGYTVRREEQVEKISKCLYRRRHIARYYWFTQGLAWQHTSQKTCQKVQFVKFYNYNLEITLFLALV